MSDDRVTKHKVRVLHGHTGWDDGDPCMTNLWFPRSYGGMQVERRSAVGTRAGDGYLWLTIRCNSVGCRFEALVRLDWLTDIVTETVTPLAPFFTGEDTDNE